MYGPREPRPRPPASSNSSESESYTATPRKRPKPQGIHLHDIGVDPTDVVGKTLTRIRMSPSHPTITLYFSDDTSFQVLVDGYDPANPGIPKELEMDDNFQTLLSRTAAQGGKIDNPMMILDCAFIQLADRAFERTKSGLGWLHDSRNELRWTEDHLGVAFKFYELGEHRSAPKWHCVWATLVEYDEEYGNCCYRTYEDVYLNKLERSRHGHKKRHYKKRSKKHPN